MDRLENNFWEDCPLVHSDPEIVHGEPVFRGTRLPAFTVTDNVEAFMELAGLSEEQAIAATLESFPTVPGGAEGIRLVLAYQHAREAQLTP